METSAEKAQKFIKISDEIKLVVDYTKTIEELIADGQYDGVDPRINAKKFPIPSEMAGKKVEVSAGLFHFNDHISSEDAISEMDKAGYRPANLMELLTFSTSFMRSQELSIIIALGSIARGIIERYVPYFEINEADSQLAIDWFNYDWGSLCCFLAVRK